MRIRLGMAISASLGIASIIVLGTYLYITRNQKNKEEDESDAGKENDSDINEEQIKDKDDMIKKDDLPKKTPMKNTLKDVKKKAMHNFKSYPENNGNYINNTCYSVNNKSLDTKIPIFFNKLTKDKSQVKMSIKKLICKNKNDNIRSNEMQEHYENLVYMLNTFIIETNSNKSTYLYDDEIVVFSEQDDDGVNLHSYLQKKGESINQKNTSKKLDLNSFGDKEFETLKHEYILLHLKREYKRNTYYWMNKVDNFILVVEIMKDDGKFIHKNNLQTKLKELHVERISKYNNKIFYFVRTNIASENNHIISISHLTNNQIINLISNNRRGFFFSEQKLGFKKGGIGTSNNRYIVNRNISVQNETSPPHNIGKLHIKHQNKEPIKFSLPYLNQHTIGSNKNLVNEKNTIAEQRKNIENVHSNITKIKKQKNSTKKFLKTTKKSHKERRMKIFKSKELENERLKFNFVKKMGLIYFEMQKNNKLSKYDQLVKALKNENKILWRRYVNLYRGNSQNSNLCVNFKFNIAANGEKYIQLEQSKRAVTLRKPKFHKNKIKKFLIFRILQKNDQPVNVQKLFYLVYNRITRTFQIIKKEMQDVSANSNFKKYIEYVCEPKCNNVKNQKRTEPEIYEIPNAKEEIKIEFEKIEISNKNELVKKIEEIIKIAKENTKEPETFEISNVNEEIKNTSENIEILNEKELVKKIKEIIKITKENTKEPETFEISNVNEEIKNTSENIEISNEKELAKKIKEIIEISNENTKEPETFEISNVNNEIKNTSENIEIKNEKELVKKIQETIEIAIKNCRKNMKSKTQKNIMICSEDEDNNKKTYILDVKFKRNTDENKDTPYSYVIHKSVFDEKTKTHLENSYESNTPQPSLKYVKSSENPDKSNNSPSSIQNKEKRNIASKSNEDNQTVIDVSSTEKINFETEKRKIDFSSNNRYPNMNENLDAITIRSYDENDNKKTYILDLEIKENLSENKNEVPYYITMNKRIIDNVTKTDPNNTFEKDASEKFSKHAKEQADIDDKNTEKSNENKKTMKDSILKWGENHQNRQREIKLRLAEKRSCLNKEKDEEMVRADIYNKIVDGNNSEQHYDQNIAKTEPSIRRKRQINSENFLVEKSFYVDGTNSIILEEPKTYSSECKIYMEEKLQKNQETAIVISTQPTNNKSKKSSYEQDFVLKSKETSTQQLKEDAKRTETSIEFTAEQLDNENDDIFPTEASKSLNNADFLSTSPSSNSNTSGDTSDEDEDLLRVLMENSEELVINLSFDEPEDGHEDLQFNFDSDSTENFEKKLKEMGLEETTDQNILYTIIELDELTDDVQESSDNNRRGLKITQTNEGPIPSAHSSRRISKYKIPPLLNSVSEIDELSFKTDNNDDDETKHNEVDSVDRNKKFETRELDPNFPVECEAIVPNDEVLRKSSLVSIEDQELGLEGDEEKDLKISEIEDITTNDKPKSFENERNQAVNASNNHENSTIRKELYVEISENANEISSLDELLFVLLPKERSSNTTDILGKIDNFKTKDNHKISNTFIDTEKSLYESQSSGFTTILSKMSNTESKDIPEFKKEVSDPKNNDATTLINRFEAGKFTSPFQPENAIEEKQTSQDTYNQDQATINVGVFKATDENNLLREQSGNQGHDQTKEHEKYQHDGENLNSNSEIGRHSMIYVREESKIPVQNLNKELKEDFAKEVDKYSSHQLISNNEKDENLDHEESRRKNTMNDIIKNEETNEQL